MRSLVCLLAAALAPAAAAAPSLTPSPADWRDVPIYQIFTDRWDDGDPANNTANPQGTYNPSSGTSINGGDFAGLTRRLGYVEGMGFEAVWISPIPLNVNGAYHGYAARDFTQIDPHWGTQQELVDFIAEGHTRGIHTVLDVVCNHGGNLIQASPSSYIAPPGTRTLSWRGPTQHAFPFNSLTHFHAQGNIGSFTDPEQILGELSDLDDLRTEDAYVRTHMIDIWTNWVTALDADGFRIDTVKHCEMEFWQVWTPAVRANLAAAGKTNFFMFGEVLDGSDAKVGSYTGTQAGGAFALDSCLDYPLFFQTNSVFAHASTGAQAIENHYSAIPGNYDPAAHDRLVTFLDNHDQPRFLSSGVANGAVARLRAALVFQFTSRGVPCLYYGTEQGFNGGNDPNDRENMFDGQFEQGPSLGDNFDQTAPLYRLVRRLNQFRRDHEALRRGTQITREVHSNPDIYAYSRVSGASEALVLVNTDPSNTEVSNTLTTTFGPGTVLTDLLDPAFTTTVSGASTVSPVTLGPSAYRLLVPLSAVTNLEPEVTAVLPVHDQSLVDVSSGVVLTFSEPMNQATVEAGFATVPASTGSFGWSSGGTVLTYVPAAPWTGNSTVRVLIAASAADLAGATLRGGFESIFHTAAGPLPDPPAAVGPLDSHIPPIVIDGATGDWLGTPGAVGTAAISASELIWNDPAGDDLGDGNYTYPTNAVFTGGDADFDEVRIAWDASNLYLLIRPVSVNPSASFFTPYFGVSIDTDQVNGSGRQDLGIESGLANGGADALLSPQLAWERQAAVPGGIPGDPSQNPPVLVDTAGTSLPGIQRAINFTTGAVEIAIPLAQIGSPAGQTWDFVPYAALETFQGIREIAATAGSFTPGGGFNSDASGNDPDIFDLAGSPAALQTAELASYSGPEAARIAQSALVVAFGTLVPAELSVFEAP